MDILNQIDPYLTSEDAVIRRFALDAVKTFPAFKPEWPERLIWAAMEDKKNTAAYLSAAQKMAPGKEVVPVLLEGSKNASAERRYSYAHIFSSLPLEVILANREQIGTVFSDERWKFMTDLKEATAEELESMFFSSLAALESSNQFDHALFTKVKRIAQRQVERGFVEPEELQRIFAAERDEKRMSLEGIVAVYKAGLLKDSRLIPELAKLFARDEDLLQEELAEALIAFQSDDVVRAVEPFAFGEDPIFPINAVAGTHSEFAVETLKKLYAATDDMEYRAFIIEGLAEQLAADGRPEIEHYMSEPFRASVYNNEQMAYGYFKVMGFDHPELGQWGRKAQESQERSLNADNQPFSETFKSLSKSIAKFPGAQQPAVSEKIGRNDPCPCGSGKKYKKCHGK